MKTLKELFGLKVNRKPSTEFDELKKANSFDSKHIPSKELFTDNSILEEHEATKRINSDPINVFLGKNYYDIGVREGFSIHSNEAAQSRKQAIKSDFRNLLTQLINQNKEDILRLTNSAVEVADLSLELKEKLENKIEFLNHQIEKYNQQMELSSQDEGFIMSAIHNYHQGFLSGMRSYMEMEKLITKSH